MNAIRPGLEGVVAFETTIAEPDKEGGALHYRGVDIEELVGRYPFEKVWGLLVDESLEPGMPRAEHIELQDPSGSVMADLQAGLATLGAKWQLKQLVDLEPDDTRDDLARLSAAALGLNASTFTARIAASTGADCAAAMSAAVGALSGPLHGGAPTRVLKMLDEGEAMGGAD